MYVRLPYLWRVNLNSSQIMTILTLIRGSNLLGTRRQLLRNTALGRELESYINGLTESGYFWEAYMTIMAGGTFLVRTDNSIEYLERIWAAIRLPDFMPTQYGLDVPSFEMLGNDVLIAIGKAYIRKLLPWKSPVAVHLPWDSTSKSSLDTILLRLKPFERSQSACLSKDGYPCQSPRQQLDYTYVASMQRILSREDAYTLRLHDLRSLYDQVIGAGYLGLAQEISYTVQTVYGRTDPAYEAFFKSTSSVSAPSLITPDAPTPYMNLEKELTCSICTDILYQPLTLLDCLHTFCGGCIKEWFHAQNAAKPVFERNTKQEGYLPVITYTCPSCRAEVRDTRGNATITTLLEMYLKIHPEQDKSEEEKKELDAIYRRGDSVLPRTSRQEATIKDLSSSSMNSDSTATEKEIIQLIKQEADSMDLHNLTPAQEDEITSRIALAYRRNQRARATDTEETKREESLYDRQQELSQTRSRIPETLPLPQARSRSKGTSSEGVSAGPVHQDQQHRASPTQLPGTSPTSARYSSHTQGPVTSIELSTIRVAMEALAKLAQTCVSDLPAFLAKQAVNPDIHTECDMLRILAEDLAEILGNPEYANWYDPQLWSHMMMGIESVEASLRTLEKAIQRASHSTAWTIVHQFHQFARPFRFDSNKFKTQLHEHVLTLNTIMSNLNDSVTNAKMSALLQQLSDAQEELKFYRLPSSA